MAVISPGGEAEEGGGADTHASELEFGCPYAVLTLKLGLCCASKIYTSAGVSLAAQTWLIYSQYVIALANTSRGVNLASITQAEL